MMQVLRGLRLASLSTVSFTAWFLLSLLPVAAYDGVPLAPRDMLWAWHWNPLLMAGLVTGAWLYSQGVKKIWWRSGVGQGIRPWQALAFNGGLTVLFLAFISPLYALSNDLFTAHMVQELLLLLVAAPLFVLGGAPLALAWSVPKSIQRRLGYWWRQQRDLHLLGRVFARPQMIWGGYLATLSLWQVPYIYKVALYDPVVHVVQPIVSLLAAILFWQLLLPTKGKRTLSTAATVRLVSTTPLVGVLLGLLIAFAPALWYPVYEPTATRWGLTGLVDQRLAGLTLVATMGLVYLGITAVHWRSWRGYRPPTTQSPIHLVNSPIQ